MKNGFLSIIKKLWTRIIGKTHSQSFIEFVSKLADIDLLFLSYRHMGILNYQNIYISGEEYVIKQVLSKYISQVAPVFFDVGANKGKYSLELRSEFPNAHIYAFEPNPNAFKILQSKLILSGDHCYCLGLGRVPKCQTIYTYSDSLDSTHASIYREVFNDIHHSNDLTSIKIEVTTIDNFCNNNNIEQIDFLKVDTEGNEIDVLKGASHMIAENKISSIQFEFNEMNVISRVFLKDFYSLLTNFNIFRLDTHRLIPLPQYDTTNEIFKFQNFLAINKILDAKC